MGKGRVDSSSRGEGAAFGSTQVTGCLLCSLACGDAVWPGEPRALNASPGCTPTHS